MLVLINESFLKQKGDESKGTYVIMSFLLDCVTITRLEHTSTSGLRVALKCSLKVMGLKACAAHVISS